MRPSYKRQPVEWFCGTSEVQFQWWGWIRKSEDVKCLAKCALMGPRIISTMAALPVTLAVPFFEGTAGTLARPHWSAIILANVKSIPFLEDCVLLAAIKSVVVSEWILNMSGLDKKNRSEGKKGGAGCMKCHKIQVLLQPCKLKVIKSTLEKNRTEIRFGL